MPPIGSERQTLDVAILGLVLPDAEQLADRRRLRIAERERADPLGGVRVAFEQYRRHAQHVGVVVEPAARIIRRQQRRDVDVEREQVAHGIRILGAIQTMCERTSRIWIGARGGIERGLERGDERVTRRGVRPRQSGWRHHARPDLADHLLPYVRVRGDVGQILRIEREVAGLQPLVVTGDAVLVDGRAAVRRGGGRRRLRRLRIGSRQDVPSEDRHPQDGRHQQRLRSRANGDEQGHRAWATRNCNVIS